MGVLQFRGELTGLITALRQLQAQGLLNAHVDAQTLEIYRHILWSDAISSAEA